MIPDTDERLASVIRALTDVVLPALPPEAGLAQEQVQLSLGHLQILRAQLDCILTYEAEELADAVALGGALANISTGVSRETIGVALGDASSARTPVEVREARKAIHGAIDALVVAAESQSQSDIQTVNRLILEAEKKRVTKDRRWYAPFGFDIAPIQD